MSTAVTITYLELNSRDQFKPARLTGEGLMVARVDPPLPELNRFFYTAVGGDWNWIDRLPWRYEQWQAYLAQPGAETWVLSVAGVPAGYFELRLQAGQTEIASFGLLPPFIGRGLGGYLLTAAVERAWELGERVWLHTCTLDHPAALAAYQARGFRSYKTETRSVELPAAPPGPWVGSR